MIAGRSRTVSSLADLLRHLMVGYPAVYPLWLGFAVIGAAGAGFALLTLRTWRWR